jgi:hypothetical protein
MRKLLTSGVVAALLVLPSAGRAQVTLGARLGFAPALGDAEQGSRLGETVASQVPIQLDALYRFTPALAAGVYLSYGFGQLGSAVSNDCKSTGASCSVRITRVGIEGTYAFPGAELPLVPWAGLGVGYEWQRLKGEFLGVPGAVTSSGVEFVNLQLGGDYRVGPQLAFGPYVLFSVGQYSSQDGNEIVDKGIHEWLQFGVRGTFDL